MSIVLETNWRENKWYQLLGFYVLLGLIQPDQPNRAVRTRMLRGVGVALSDGRPYPDRIFHIVFLEQYQLHSAKQ